MELRYMQNMFDGGKKYNPIIIPVQIQSVVGAAVTNYIKIPLAMRIMGFRVRAMNAAVNATESIVTVSHGYVSAGDVNNMDDYCEQMTAAELSALGITVVAATTASILLTKNPETRDLLYEADTATTFPSSGSNSDTTAPGGSSVRVYGQLVADDVLIVSVSAATGTAPMYHIDILAASNE